MYLGITSAKSKTGTPAAIPTQEENLHKLGKSDDYLELYGVVGEDIN